MTDYTDSVTDNILILVTLDTTVNYGVSVSDSMSEEDTCSALVVFNDGVVDSITMGDTPDGSSIFHVNESITITDISTAIAVINTSRTDFMTVSAATFSSCTFDGATTDSISITDMTDGQISENTVDALTLVDLTDATIGPHIPPPFEPNPTLPPVLPPINPAKIQKYYRDQLRILKYTYRKSPLG
jgi:hypothetical protein